MPRVRRGPGLTSPHGIGSGWERVREIGIGNGTARRVAAQARTGDGPATSVTAISITAISVLAIGKRREIVAVDADRHHGKGRSPGNSQIPLRTIDPDGSACAFCAAGVRLRAVRLSFQPAKLNSSLPAAPAYSPAICSLARWQPSR